MLLQRAALGRAGALVPQPLCRMSHIGQLEDMLSHRRPSSAVIRALTRQRTQRAATRMQADLKQGAVEVAKLASKVAAKTPDVLTDHKVCGGGVRVCGRAGAVITWAAPCMQLHPGGRPRHKPTLGLHACLALQPLCSPFTATPLPLADAGAAE